MPGKLPNEGLERYRILDVIRAENIRTITVGIPSYRRSTETEYEIDRRRSEQDISGKRQG